MAAIGVYESPIGHREQAASQRAGSCRNWWNTQIFIGQIVEMSRPINPRFELFCCVTPIRSFSKSTAGAKCPRHGQDHRRVRHHCSHAVIGYHAKPTISDASATSLEISFLPPVSPGATCRFTSKYAQPDAVSAIRIGSAWVNPILEEDRKRSRDTFERIDISRPVIGQLRRQSGEDFVGETGFREQMNVGKSGLAQKAHCELARELIWGCELHGEILSVDQTSISHNDVTNFSCIVGW